MSFDYINEAFKKLDLLEDLFDTSIDGINNLEKFMDTEDVEDTVYVIDKDAASDDELSDSYVGKVIVNCNVCHSHIFENKDDVMIDEQGVVNIEEVCPYCGEQEGFTIIGEIAPYSAATEPEESTEAPEAADDVMTDDTTSEEKPEEINEALGIGAGLALGGAALGAGKVVASLLDSVEDDKDDETLTEKDSANMSLASKRLVNEDFKEVSITTEDQHMEMTSDENGKVTVTTEPVVNEAPVSYDVIVPVSDETEAEILQNNDVATTEDELSDETSEDEFDLDFDEVDEEGLDELGEAYLRKVYENVESFKTTGVSANSKTLIVEGVIKFTSGASKKTGFIFEAADANSKGQLRFNGFNKQLAESKNAFSLVGRIDNKKLFVESLKYNYGVNDSSIRGLVRRK